MFSFPRSLKDHTRKHSVENRGSILFHHFIPYWPVLLYAFCFYLWQAQDINEVTKYGKHFLVLGSAHGFVIYNGLSWWPGSDAFTCRNPKGDASTADYLMGSPSLIPKIKEFTISGRPIGLATDHAYLCFDVKDGCWKNLYAKNGNGLAKYQFTPEIIDVCSCGVYNMHAIFGSFCTPRGSHTRIF